jgi:hypothetical protein
VLNWLVDRFLAHPARAPMAALAVGALIGACAVLVFVPAPGTNDREPKPGRDVSAPPPQGHDADPATNSAPAPQIWPASRDVSAPPPQGHDADPATNSAPTAPQIWPAGRERAVREYAADFLRWERGMKPASKIRHATPELRRLLGVPPRITPASRPPELAHNKHGLMGIDVYLEADTAQVRVRVGAGGMADHMGDKGPGIHRWESFGVQLGRFDGRWMVTAHNS